MSRWNLSENVVALIEGTTTQEEIDALAATAYAGTRWAHYFAPASTSAAPDRSTE